LKEINFRNHQKHDNRTQSGLGRKYVTWQKRKNWTCRRENVLKERDSIKICTYNIIHGGGIALAMKTMKTMKINLGVLVATKVSKGMYTKEAHGYTIVNTEAQSNIRLG
jgi:hypothetical protein